MGVSGGRIHNFHSKRLVFVRNGLLDFSYAAVALNIGIVGFLSLPPYHGHFVSDCNGFILIVDLFTTHVAPFDHPSVHFLMIFSMASL